MSAVNPGAVVLSRTLIFPDDNDLNQVIWRPVTFTQYKLLSLTTRLRPSRVAHSSYLVFILLAALLNGNYLHYKHIKQRTIIFYSFVWKINRQFQMFINKIRCKHLNKSLWTLCLLLTMKYSQTVLYVKLNLKYFRYKQKNWSKLNSMFLFKSQQIDRVYLTHDLRKTWTIDSDTDCIGLILEMMI